MTIGIGIIPLTMLMLMVQQTPKIVVAEDEEGCVSIPAPQLGKGWERNACSDSDRDSWTNPRGEDCYANTKTGTTRCGEGPGNPPISVN